MLFCIYCGEPRHMWCRNCGEAHLVSAAEFKEYTGDWPNDGISDEEHAQEEAAK